MLRFLIGAGSATLLLLAGFFIWKGVASRNETGVVPHDRRFDAIHFQVGGADFFGMADLSLDMTMAAQPTQGAD